MQLRFNINWNKFWDTPKRAPRATRGLRPNGWETLLSLKHFQIFHYLNFVFWIWILFLSFQWQLEYKLKFREVHYGAVALFDLLFCFFAEWQKISTALAVTSKLISFCQKNFNPDIQQMICGIVVIRESKGWNVNKFIQKPSYVL